MTGGNGTATGFRRLWNIWDVNAVTAEFGGVLSGGWAVYPGTWYTASTKPTDCPIIAFVDFGVDMNHPDFINAGGTGTDTAEGGQLIKSLSTNFSNGMAVPGGDPTDQNGHGTHICGIAIASGNNGGLDGDGMIGIGYNSRGMVLRVFDPEGNATDANVAAAIMYAADNGAAIINVSLGSTNFSQVVQDAVTYAFQKGSLIVAAGNESAYGGGNLGPIYPAACSGALGVTANSPGRISADRDYAGSGNYVGIAAPGGDLVPAGKSSFYVQYVFSTACRYDCTLSEAKLNPPYSLNYAYLYGTSVACPHVSGAAGLYYGENHLHQSDGFANLKAFQALESSADGTGRAKSGGWEPTQGFGSLDVQQLVKLSTNPNPRFSTVGDVTGIVYFGGSPKANAGVYAREVASPNKTYRTTTSSDGTYRFVPFPGGVYDISTSVEGSTKTRRVQVADGCDVPGIDFFTGPTKQDKTPPVVARFSFLGQTKTTMDFDQWAYDTESEIESATVQIGTTAEASNVLAPQVILPGETKVHLTGLKLPSHYFATFKYTNGVGAVSQATHAVESNLADATVTDNRSKSNSDQTKINVSSGNSGSNQICFVQLELASLQNNISDVQLTLTGGAKAGSVVVGVYGTNNPAWTEGGLTWSNAPQVSGSAVDTQTVGASGPYTWNVGPLVQAAKAAGRKTVTIAVKCVAGSSAGATFESMKSGSGAPLVQWTSHDANITAS